MEDYAALGCWDDVCSQPQVKPFAQDPAPQRHFDLNCSSSPICTILVFHTLIYKSSMPCHCSTSAP
ncbi:hypothetical protein CROQUDRAFT_450206 [Cronartium quercuum f. sp. fusiforme G11]|uniref:Uncharacterized protein n=1 Tax=Cronartium quercuum f. sp. fusiforme G11 TaxID=708437 RepID=A0A9P6NLG9_9BASI|nr:hypothetical protein CROQUDRAFT_450206 [Cronartium quercuum f. sp. fusiforme G11]